MQKAVLLSFVVIIILSFTAAAQETEDNASAVPVVPSLIEERLTVEQKEKENPALKGLKLEKEIKPRLPNGFAPVVDSAQREKIYDIQRAYNELIAFLELRIQLLKEERDTKINAVLTPAQQERIKQRPARRILPR